MVRLFTAITVVAIAIATIAIATITVFTVRAVFAVTATATVALLLFDFFRHYGSPYS